MAAGGRFPKIPAARCTAIDFAPMCPSHDRTRNQNQPTRLAILIGAPASLYVLKAWSDAGSASPTFWRQALLIAIAAAVTGAGAWWRIRVRRQRPRPAGISSHHDWHLADLLTLGGLLLLVGLLWMDVRGFAVDGAAGLARTVLTLGAVWGMLAGVIWQAARLPVVRAWSVHRLRATELSVILQLSVVVFWLLPANPPTGDAAWVAAVLTTGVTLFAGQIVLQVLRRPGVAIMVIAAVLFYRALANFVLAQQPDAASVGAAVQFLALAPAGALDVAYAVRLADADARQTLHFALAVSVGVALAAVLIFWPQLPGVPPLTPGIGLLVVASGAAIGIACGWCGTLFGRAARGSPDH